MNQVSTWKENNRHVMLKRRRVPDKVDPKFDVAVPYCRRLASARAVVERKMAMPIVGAQRRNAQKNEVPAGP